MAIVGSSIVRDIKPGCICGIRTVFFSDNSSKSDYVGIKLFTPDFDLINHSQLSAILELLDKDIEYLEKSLTDDV